MDRADLGLDLLLAGMGLGMALMTFVAAFDSTSFYQTVIGPTLTEGMRPFGYGLDAAAVLSLAMSVAGIACVSGAPPAAAAAASSQRVTAEDRLAELRRRKAARARKSRAVSQGST